MLQVRPGRSAGARGRRNGGFPERSSSTSVPPRFFITRSPAGESSSHHASRACSLFFLLLFTLAISPRRDHLLKSNSLADMAFSSSTIAIRSASRVGSARGNHSRLPAVTSKLSYPLALAGATFAGVVSSLWGQQSGPHAVKVDETLLTSVDASPDLAERPAAAVPRLELDLGHRPLDSDDAPLLGSDLPAPSPSLSVLPPSRDARKDGRAPHKPTTPSVRPLRPAARLPLSGRPADLARVNLTPLSAATPQPTPAANGIQALYEKVEKDFAEFKEFEDLRKKLDDQDCLTDVRARIDLCLCGRFDIRDTSCALLKPDSCPCLGLVRQV